MKADKNTEAQLAPQNANKSAGEEQRNKTDERGKQKNGQMKDTKIMGNLNDRETEKARERETELTQGTCAEKYRRVRAADRENCPATQQPRRTE